MPEPDAGVKPGAGAPQATDSARESLATTLAADKALADGESVEV